MFFIFFQAQFSCASGVLGVSTLITKEKKIFLHMSEIHNGSGAKSYMRKGFLIYEEMQKYLVIYEEAISHI